jgi:ring-1,2-phenylacetyl-CoA epoxidase subunit PaaC
MRTDSDTANAYTGLVEPDEDTRWAFGGGFDDPLSGLDVAVPEGIDAAALAAYCLMLGDDALVLAQRLNLWCTHAPELEEEVALANIALDLLGQTRMLYARAAAADPSTVPSLPDGSPVPAEDRLAFFRDAQDFRCVQLVELPDEDFATVVVRLTLFAFWRQALLEALEQSADPVLSAVAAKGAKELRYHVDYAARWVLTLAGGTEESRQRVERAITSLLPYAEQFSATDARIQSLVDGGVAPDPRHVADLAVGQVRALLERAGVAPTGADGVDDDRTVRTSSFGELLHEMQGLARAHPMGRW